MSDTPQSTAKLFMHGRSQAVRLPKEFRFVGSEVYVRRQGEDVVLSSRPRASIQSLIDALGEFEPGHPLVRAQPAPGAERAPIAPQAPNVAPQAPNVSPHAPNVSPLSANLAPQSANVLPPVPRRRRRATAVG